MQIARDPITGDIAEIRFPDVAALIRRFAASLSGPVRRYAERQRVRNELYGLSARDLRDIGLTRSEIPEVLRGRISR